MAAPVGGLEHVLEVTGAVPSVVATLAPSPATSGGAWARAGEVAAKVARYVLLEELGRGAMGVVYAAYDPELDRRIAVKVVAHPARTESLGEAQSLARLNHPNVVSVYDAGEERGRVFMAMELVDGETLDEWRARVHPSTREVVEVFQKAAEGLAAAHAAGLVHRDFKPANVMIDRRGRVVVMDFGLAIERRVDIDGDDERGGEPGWAAGTPAYMAPEQFAGEAVGPAADQFSFFVALHEALTGARPFGGDSVHALALAVTEGKLRDEGRLRARPSWLRRLVLVGLALDPERRHPTMEHVAREMGHGMARQHRRRIGLVGGAGVLGLALVIGVLATTPDGEALACDASASELDATWLPSWRARARAPFEQLGADGPALWKRVDTNVERFASSWGETHRRACVEHFEDRVTSAQVHAMRLGCLAEQRAYVLGLVDGVGGTDAPDGETGVSGDPDALRRIVALSGELPRPETCGAAESDPGALDRSRREVVAEARVDAMRALGLYRAGSPAAAPLAEGALAAIHNEDAPTTKSELASLLSNLDYEAGELDAGRAHQQDALRWAMASGSPRLQAKAWLDFVESMVSHHHEIEQAAALLEPVALAVENAPENDEFLAQLDALRGVIALQRGRAEEARTAFQAAVDRDVDSVPPTVRLAHLSRLAAATAVKGDVEAAQILFERSLDLATELYGERHIKVAGAHGNLALTCRQLGDRTCERDHLERAIEASPPGTPTLAKQLVTLAQLEYDLEKLERAEELVDRALAIYLDTYGPRHATLTAPRLLRCNLYRRRGDTEALTTEANELVAVAEATTSENDPKRAIAATVQGEAFRARGELDEAREAFERALETRERALDEGDVRIGYSLFNLADLAVQTEEPERAAELARRALAIFEARPGTERWQADAHLVLARVVGNRKATRAHAERARELFEGLGNEGASGAASAAALLE